MLCSFCYPQISDARLSAADFAVLASCVTLKHLFVRFSYQPDASPGTSTAHDLVAGGGLQASQSNGFGLFDFILPRELQSSLRLAAHGSHGMVTRLRKSLRGMDGRRSSTSTASMHQLSRDCADATAPYVLQPLLRLRMLISLELLEEPQAPASLKPRPRAAELGASNPSIPVTTTTDAGGTIAVRTRRSLMAAAKAADATSPSASAAAEAYPGVVSQALLPCSRSGLDHFLMNVAHLDKLTAVSIRLLTEETDMTDCPCATSCFTNGTKGKGSRPTLNEETVRAKFSRIDTGCYKFVLGKLVVQSPKWYRPSAWPSLEG